MAEAAGSTKFGWVGLGAMGAAFVENLLKKGFSVAVWNRSADKSEAVAASGATVCRTAAEVVSSCDVTFVMVSDPAAARELYQQKGGIIEGLPSSKDAAAEKGIIECATLGSTCVAELALLVQSKGARFLAAPALGHSGTARDATCQFACAGDESLLAQAADALQAISRKQLWLGPNPATASNLKLVVNGLLANIAASVAEATSLAKNTGVPAAALKEIISNHAMNSPLLQLCVKSMQNQSHDPTLFALKHMAKDVKLAAALAEEHGIPHTVTSGTANAYSHACESYADKNFTAVGQSIEDRSSAVNAAYKNHIDAFGAQDVEKILIDYSDDSQLIMYNMSSGGQSAFNGLAEIQKFFEETFTSMQDLSSLAVRHSHTNACPEPSAFLVWECPSSGIEYATDTFIFDEAGKIQVQTLVVWIADGIGFAGQPNLNLTTAPQSGPVQASWNNHFAAFGGQNMSLLLKDYSDRSVICVHDKTSNTSAFYRGLTGVTQCFTGLFAKLSDLSTLGAPVVHVREGPFGAVFLVWKCPSSGVSKGTDTFVFDGEGLISYQHVVVETK
eukprot:INCI14725.5.p1 GENE.INCI14725.5~~INCI14725.5.p1  ORF type:complete len:560 (-),score=100.95 INCI14725.5:1691-3370(-)